MAHGTGGLAPHSAPTAGWQKQITHPHTCTSLHVLLLKGTALAGALGFTGPQSILHSNNALIPRDHLPSCEVSSAWCWALPGWEDRNSPCRWRLCTFILLFMLISKLSESKLNFHLLSDESVCTGFWDDVSVNWLNKPKIAQWTWLPYTVDLVFDCNLYFRESVNGNWNSELYIYLDWRMSETSPTASLYPRDTNCVNLVWGIVFLSHWLIFAFGFTFSSLQSWWPGTCVCQLVLPVLPFKGNKKGSS